MSDFWAFHNGLDVAAAIIQIPQELKKIRELLEAKAEGREAASVATRVEDVQQTSAIDIAERAASEDNVQHIAFDMQFGEMQIIYDTSNNPDRRGKRLGIVTRGDEGWLIENAMIRMGPHGNERRTLVENRKVLVAAISKGMSIMKVAKLEPHPKHENAIKVYFRLPGQMLDDEENLFLGYLAADVSDFIMHTSFGGRNNWEDRAELDVLSFKHIGASGLRVNLAIMDAHRRDRMRNWVAEMEEGLFTDYI